MDYRFLSGLAVEQFPRWLFNDIGRESLTVCDWGCDRGEGTAVLGNLVGPSQVTGVGFSAAAVAEAARRHPAIRFIDGEAESETGNFGEVFDVVFSLNTLEHFDSPQDALDLLSRHARKGLVLVLSYGKLGVDKKEDLRLSPPSIPMVLGGGFRLVWCRVVHWRTRDRAHWGGGLVLLVFTDPGWLDGLCLKMDDCEISCEDYENGWLRFQAMIDDRDNRIARQNRTIEDQERQIASIQLALAERETRIEGLDRQLRLLVSSRSWKLTRPLRVIGRLARSPRSTSAYLARRAHDLLPAGAIKAAFWKVGSGVLGWEASQQGVGEVGRPLPLRRFETWTEFENEVLSRRTSFKGTLIQSSVIPWNVPTYQRPQQMAVAFGRLGYLVIFRSTSELEGRDMQVAEEIAENVWLTGFEKVADLTNVVTTYYSTTYWHTVDEYVASARQGPVIYEYIDHIDPSITGVGTVPALRELQRFAFRGGADCIIASARALEEEAIEATGTTPVLYVPNGVDTTHYAVMSGARASARFPQRYSDFVERFPVVIGYFGALAPWLWYSMLRDLVSMRPDLGFVFIGPDHLGAAAELPQADNLLWLGPVDYKVLPNYGDRFSVAIIPFEPGDIARTTSPLKLFEYFALGKPVVVTADMHECTAFSEVLTADSAETFSLRIDEAIRLSGDPGFSARLKRLAEENDWVARARAMEIVFAGVHNDRQTALALATMVTHEIAQCYRDDNSPDADYYETTHSKEEVRSWLPVLRWIDDLTQVRSVADIGAGYGTLLLYAVKRHNPAIRTAIDPVGRLSMAFVKVNQIERFMGDFERQQLLDGRQFDLVIFADVLGRLNYAPGHTLNRLHSLVAPGGSLLLVTPDADEWGRQTRYYEKLQDIPQYRGQADQWIDDDVWRYTKGEVDDVLGQAGFHVDAFLRSPGVNGGGLCYLCRKPAESQFDGGGFVKSVARRFAITPKFIEDYFRFQQIAFDARSDYDQLIGALDPLRRMWVEFALTTTIRGREMAQLHAKQQSTHVQDDRQKTYLDVGCGYGGFLRAFAEQGFLVTGLEVAPYLAAFSRSNVDDLQDATIIEGDLLTYPVEALGKFDCVTCNDVIEHVEEAGLALERLASLVGRGGVLLMEVPNKDCIDSVMSDGHFQIFGITCLRRHEAAKYYEQLTGNSGYLSSVGEFYELGYYVEALKAKGLDVQVALLHMSGEFSDTASKIVDLERAHQQWLLSQAPRLSAEIFTLVENRYDAYRRQVINELIEARVGNESVFAQRYLARAWTLIARAA